MLLPLADTTEVVDEELVGATAATAPGAETLPTPLHLQVFEPAYPLGV